MFTRTADGGRPATLADPAFQPPWADPSRGSPVEHSSPPPGGALQLGGARISDARGPNLSAIGLSSMKNMDEGVKKVKKMASRRFSALRRGSTPCAASAFRVARFPFCSCGVSMASIPHHRSPAQCGGGTAVAASA